MPWWGWLLIGYILGAASLGALLVAFRRRRDGQSQPMAEDLAAAEAQLHDQEIERQAGDVEARADEERERVVEFVEEDDGRLKDDPEKQIDDVMGHL